MKTKVRLLIILLLCLGVCGLAASDGTLRLPGSVRAIGAWAYAGDVSIREVVLPEGVREIGARAFAYSGLQTIHLPDSLEAIADNAFEGCDAIKVTANRGSTAFAWAVNRGYIQAALSVRAAALQSEVSEGDEAVITATVTGAPSSVTYQWQSSANGRRWTNLDCATDTRRFAASEAACALYYRCAVTDDLGVLYSNAVHLTWLPRVTASTEITLGVGEQYALELDSLHMDGKTTWVSSSPKVVEVGGDGVIRAVGRGTAVVSCYSSEVFQISFRVRVYDAPKSVTFETKALTLGVGESRTLTPVIPESTRTTFSWFSANPKIAEVDDTGVVTGRKTGSTTVKVTTRQGRKATLSVKVVKAPKSIALNHASMTLEPGERKHLVATLTSGAASDLQWSSSAPNVAAVNASGNVEAIGAGEATITARTFNGREAACAVTVTRSNLPNDEGVRCRALLIGQERFANEVCRRNRGDVSLMEDMLRHVRGQYGGAFSIEKRYDLDRDGTLDAIHSAFGEADENDVSLFFIATHGDITGTGSEAGSLNMSPTGSLTLGDLADALASVPGQVIVLLESCGSGAGVYDEKAVEAAAQSAVRAFAAADVRVADGGAVADAAGFADRMTGELRVNKFFVLTASAYQENSYGWEDDKGATYNYFTKWLTDGVGLTGRMPADVNGDGLLTLRELYGYISGVSDDSSLGVWAGREARQHVQVYPGNSGFVLFRR